MRKQLTQSLRSTGRPNLTMDVIKIGKVTDALSVFSHLNPTVSMTFE